MSRHIERALEILRGSRYACQYNSEVAGRLDQIERELMLEVGEDPVVRESDEVRELFPHPEPDLEPVVEGDDLSDEDE